MCSDDRPGMTAGASVWKTPTPRQKNIMCFRVVSESYNFPLCFVPACSVVKYSCQKLTTTAGVSQSYVGALNDSCQAGFVNATK